MNGSTGDASALTANTKVAMLIGTVPLVSERATVPNDSGVVLHGGLEPLPRQPFDSALMITIRRRTNENPNRFGAGSRVIPAGNGRRTGVRQCAPRGAGAGKSEISLTEAIRIAEKEGNGQATSAEYEFKNGNAAYYEIKVLRNDGQKLTKYELSPSTGTVRKSATRSSRSCSPGSNRRHSECADLSDARHHNGGNPRRCKAKEAEVNRDGDQLQYKIEVVKLDAQ